MLTAVLIGVAEMLGFVVLLPASVMHAWTAPPAYISIKPVLTTQPARLVVDEWRWNWLNAWYGNSEDGVSGQQALLQVDGQYVYYPTLFPSWTPKWCIAYAWSAWRNGANNLKRPLRPAGQNTPVT
jgi:hypothetical protein